MNNPTTSASSARAYQPRRTARSLFVPVRGQRYHLNLWGDPSLIRPDRPALVLGHGYMDLGASFQFMVDALAELEGDSRFIVAPDWRGFGQTEGPATDDYVFNDYLADLDTLLDAPELGLPAGQPIDLLGHSMGGNVVMMYAGVRPERIRRLVNLEGFGLPVTRASQAPGRLLQWLDSLKTPAQLQSYDSVEGVARRLMKNNPRLAPDRAAWLAAQWSALQADGRWHLRADPAHKRMGSQLYRVDEVLACWSRISAPLLWVEGDLTDLSIWWGQRYSQAEFHERLKVVAQVEKQLLSPSGHMLHHDQPEALAQRLRDFLQR